ncbi:MAG: hypothetical protein K2M30_01965 [Desulfovibrionaceae bacterium]|nr:hypothetical protein [Desulfovibrionaceae bacterium]
MQDKKLDCMIATIFTIYGHSLTSEMVKAWKLVLEEYDMDILSYAFKHFLKTRVYSSIPLPAEICVICEKMLESIRKDYTILKQSITVPEHLVTGTGFNAKIETNAIYQEECKRLYQVAKNKNLSNSKKLSYN